MTDTPNASEAARELSRMRWGSTRTDRLIAELHDRADQLGAKQLGELQELVDEATEKVSD